VSLDADQIRDLLDYNAFAHYNQRHRLEHPVGLTWAVAVATDDDPHGQKRPIDIANARALDALFEENEAWGPDWDSASGYYIYRLLDQQGQPTPIAKVLGPILLGLLEYSSIDDDLVSEVEDEHWDQYWEHDVIGEIENESLRYWKNGKDLTLDFEDVELPDDWQDQLYEGYRMRDSGGSYDDQGYTYPDMDTVVEVIDRLGWLATSTISVTEAEALVDETLAQGEVRREGWGMLRNQAGIVHLLGDPPSPLVRVLQDRHLSYMLPRDRGE